MNQLHAGTSSLNGRPLWHSDDGKGYWCGHCHHLTPEDLLRECQTTICDLFKNHPELRK